MGKEEKGRAGEGDILGVERKGDNLLNSHDQLVHLGKEVHEKAHCKVNTGRA